MTGTDIARMDTNAVAVLGGATDALARLGEWVTAARSARELVAPLVNTAFIPEAYKPKIDPRATDEQRRQAYEVAVANATAAVLQGITLGLDPLTALQQIYIVHGRPGMYAKLMVALVQSHGHEVWDEDLSDTRAVVCGRRRGSEHTVRVTITMDQARKAGWTSNQAYTKTPQDMLWARAAGRVCDRIASDVLKGIATVEEVRDTIQAEATVGTGERTVAPRRRTPAPLPATTVDDAPPLDDDQATTATTEPAPPAAEPAGDDRMITPAMSKKLYAQLRDLDLDDKDLALVHIAGILDKEIQSTKELTFVDARAVIDHLDAEIRERNKTAQTGGDEEPTLDV